MSGRTSIRDRLLSGLVLPAFIGGIWLTIGFLSGEARVPAKGLACMPVCHRCAEIGGTMEGPGPKQLARRCARSCRPCSEARQAARHLDSVLLVTGGMEPG